MTCGPTDCVPWSAISTGASTTARKSRSRHGLTKNAIARYPVVPPVLGTARPVTSVSDCCHKKSPPSCSAPHVHGYSWNASEPPTAEPRR